MKAYEITLKLDEVDHITQRKLIIPTDLTFKKLHEIISLVFNFSSEEKYRFIFNEINLEIRDTGRISRDIIDSRYEKIDKYFHAFKELTYKNNFWTVTIALQEKEYEKNYPRIISCNGIYNPSSEIGSVKEFSQLIKLKKDKEELASDDLDQLENLEYFNKLKIEEELMNMFNIPYEKRNKKVYFVDRKNTLDNIL